MIPFLSVETPTRTAPDNSLVQRESGAALPGETAFAMFLTSQAQMGKGPVPVLETDAPLPEEEIELLTREAGADRAKGDPLEYVLLASQNVPSNERMATEKSPEGPTTAPGRLPVEQPITRGLLPVSAAMEDGKQIPQTPVQATTVPVAAAEADIGPARNAGLPDRRQIADGQGRATQQELPDPHLATERPKTSVLVSADSPRAASVSPPHGAITLPQGWGAAKQVVAQPAARMPDRDRQVPTPDGPRPGPEHAMARSPSAPAAISGGAQQTQVQNLPRIVDSSDSGTKALDPATGLSNAMPERLSSQSALPVNSASHSTAPDTARHAASQMAVAIAQKPGQTTDIALQPEELGRVRMSLSVIENSVTLTVNADRPETADLLRRHIDVLAQEFRALGYADINFSFGGEGGGGGKADFADQAEGVKAERNDDAEEASPAPTVPGGGLDLRI